MSKSKDNAGTRPQEEVAEPFLSWAGGKRQIIPILATHLPLDIKQRRYVEPFLGAASLFFTIAPGQALLSDANQSLIQAYQQIKEHPEAVLAALRLHFRQHSKEHYYSTREAFNRFGDSSAQAARFIYLNRACFNGIYRVNQKGHFNVPKGSKNKLMPPSTAQFKAISNLLSRARMRAADYVSVLAEVSINDFVYLDPPYPALNKTAYFNHYTVDRFDSAAQERLAKHTARIASLGAKIMMSNADLPEIRRLYAGFEIAAIPVKRFVSCKGIRTAVSELIIKNYR